MLKLEDIANAVYFEFRRAQLDAMKTERLGSIHVSDLIKPCMRNVIYSKVEPRSGTTTEDMRSLYFGQCVHSNSQLATEENHEKFLAYDYVRDEALTREESLKIPDEDPRQLDIIYGSIDDLLKIDGKWVITDKKTTGSIDYFSRATAKASDSHKDQINRYRVLLKKCYDIDAEFGAVIYISNSIDKEKKDKPAIIPFKLRPIEETLQDMIEKSNIIKKSLTEEYLPERTKNYLCDGFCPYATKCFEDNREKWSE